MGQRFERVDILKNGKGVKLHFKQSSLGKGGVIVGSENDTKVDQVPHSDLVSCFTKLAPHLMYACELAKIVSHRQEWFDEYKFLDLDEFEGINVTGLVISGKDYDMIKLIGSKTTSTKQVIAINSPLIWLDDESDNKYPLIDLLRTLVSSLLNEAELYSGGKYAPASQGEMEFN